MGRPTSGMPATPPRPVTVIPYMYRDRDNYKQHSTVRVAGEFTDADTETLRCSLDEGEMFAPRDVGLEHLFEMSGWSWSEGDHCWHELNLDDRSVVLDGDPVDFESPALIARVFSEAKAAGWPDQFVDHDDDDEDEGDGGDGPSDDELVAARTGHRSGLCGRATVDGSACRNPAGGCPHH